MNLVNEARELTEEILDKLRRQCNDTNSRPRMKREICRKRYLEIIKHPKNGISKRHGALRFLLNTIRRNLEFIANLCEGCENTPQVISEQLIMIRTLHDQQRTVSDNHSRRIDDRIVRTIVRNMESGLPDHVSDTPAKIMNPEVLKQ